MNMKCHANNQWLFFLASNPVCHLKSFHIQSAIMAIGSFLHYSVWHTVQTFHQVFVESHKNWKGKGKSYCPQVSLIGTCAHPSTNTKLPSAVYLIEATNQMHTVQLKICCSTNQTQLDIINWTTANVGP